MKSLTLAHFSLVTLFSVVMVSCANEVPSGSNTAVCDTAGIINHYLTQKSNNFLQSNSSLFASPDTGSIGPELARQMIRNYETAPIEGMPMALDENGKRVQIRSFFVGMDDLKTILINKKFAAGRGLRIYLGKNTRGNYSLILVGVDKDLNNITDKDCILDDFNTCPPKTNCPSTDDFPE